MDLKIIEKRTKAFIEEHNLDEKLIVEQANKALSRQQQEIKSETDKLVVHPASYSGAFILFGGWTKIYDSWVPKGTRGHELYLAMGGVGAGGWSGDCDIELTEYNGTVVSPDGRDYIRPKFCYCKDPDNVTWAEAQTGFTWFYDHVKSFIYMYIPAFIVPRPVFDYFDSNSTSIGCSVPNVNISTAIGGGTVSVEK